MPGAGTNIYTLVSGMSGTLAILLELQNDPQMKACAVGNVAVMTDRHLFSFIVNKYNIKSTMTFSVFLVFCNRQHYIFQNSFIILTGDPGPMKKSYFISFYPCSPNPGNSNLNSITVNLPLLDIFM